MRSRFLAATLLAAVCSTAIAPQYPAVAAVRPTTCDTNVDVAQSTATTANLVPVPRQGSQRVHVCSIIIAAAGADVVSLVTGTGSTCTSPTTLLGPVTMGTSETISEVGGVGDVLVVPAGQALCLTTTTTAIVGGNLMVATY